MTKNILYRPIYHREIKIYQHGNKNEILTISEIGSWFDIKYGTPSENIREVCSYQDYLHTVLGYEEGYYGKKNRKYGYYIENGKTKIYERDFISAKKWFTNKEIDLKDIKMEYLIKNLNADEFMLFMNDHNIKPDKLIK